LYYDLTFGEGVSSGIGQQIAYKFASNGWVVYGTLRNIVNQKETFLKEALANNVDVSKLHVIQMNVDSLEAPSQIQEIIKKEGHIDILVNNAGFMIQGPIESISNEDLLNQFETNLFGPIRLCQAVLPIMRSRKSGRIINISSVVAHIAFPMLGVYPATKSALESISESIQKEVADYGIKVIVIEPGFTRTSFQPNTKQGTRKIDEEASKHYNSWHTKIVEAVTPYFITLPNNGSALVANTVYKSAIEENPVFRYYANDTDDKLISTVLKDNKHFAPSPTFN